MEICDFDRQFSFDSYLLNLSSNFTKMVTFESYKPGLSDCERRISVDYIMNALEHSKVRLPFFLYTLYTMQCFLTRCYKRNYSSKYDIYKLLEKSDRNIFRKIKNNGNHPLKHMLPIVKDSCRRNKSSLWPKCNTERFKSSFFNRLIFKYKLHVNNE